MSSNAHEINEIMKQVSAHQITADAGTSKALRVMLRFGKEKTRQLHEDIAGLESTIEIQNRALGAMAYRTPRFIERLFGRVCAVRLDTVKVG